MCWLYNILYIVVCQSLGKITAVLIDTNTYDSVYIKALEIQKDGHCSLTMFLEASFVLLAKIALKCEIMCVHMCVCQDILKTNK